MHDPLRIACYGYAQPDAGSVSSAGCVILRELLERGHQIDFFGKRSFAYPAGLESYPNFRYVEVEGAWEKRFGRWCQRGPSPWRAVMGSLLARQTERNVPLAIAAEHVSRKYAVQLYLGNWAFGRVKGLPTVSWVQGPPGTDSRSIARHREQLVRLDGASRYAALRAFAAYRDTIGLPPFQHSDVVICGSNWSETVLRPYLAGSVTIEKLPYPIDINTFRPDEAEHTKASGGAATVLWLGRSVPRKRLDLFLAACEKLIDQGRDIQVHGVGGFGFAPGYRRLLKEFRYPQRLRWEDGIPRAQVPALLQKATVLVQPSEEENFGSSVAEALACGTPVVVGPTNGTGDYVGKGGRIFCAYQPESVANAIAEVLDGVMANPQGCSALARAAAEAAFDVRAIVDRLETVLLRATAHQAEPPGARIDHHTALQ